MKYYSFHIGNYKADKRSWLLVDIKLPAPDLRTAITLYMFLEMFTRSKGNTAPTNINIHIPTRLSVKQRICMVSEYEKLLTPKLGYTVHRYKKLAQYRAYDFLQYFKTCSYEKFS